MILESGADLGAWSVRLWRTAPTSSAWLVTTAPRAFELRFTRPERERCRGTIRDTAVERVTGSNRHGQLGRFGLRASSSLVSRLSQNGVPSVCLGSASRHRAPSVRAVDRDGEGCADLPHECVGQPSEPRFEDRVSDALDGIRVDHTAVGDRVIARREADLADKAADRGGAWRDESAPVSRDHRLAGTTSGQRPNSARSRPQTSPRAGSAVTTVQRLAKRRQVTPLVDHGGLGVPGSSRPRGCPAPAHRERGSSHFGAPPRDGAAWEAGARGRLSQSATCRLAVVSKVLDHRGAAGAQETVAGTLRVCREAMKSRITG